LPGSQYVLEVITWAGDLQAKTSVYQWTGKVDIWVRPQVATNPEEVGVSRQPCPNVVMLLGPLAPELVPLSESRALPGPGYALSTLRPGPVPPDHLVLRALGISALQAYWNSSQGAAWLHLVLADFLGGSNLTAVVRRGVSNHTFFHLSPGTAYELTLSAAAGPHRVVGPNATEWTCECLGVVVEGKGSQ
jgi:hypothetical protein